MVQVSSPTHYVAGFMFRDNRRQVALIRKTHPKWQMGKLNAIGGKVNAGEQAYQAVVREFLEETSIRTTEWDWRCFATLKNPLRNGVVDFFVTDLSPLQDRVQTLESVTDEFVDWYNVKWLLSFSRRPMMDNLRWLIPMARDESKVQASILDPS